MYAMAHHDTAPTDLSWADGLQPDWPAPVGVHAFFTTRSGGCSAAPFDRLNLGDHVGDQVQAVQTNRRALQVLLRSVTPEARAVFLRQVHGCEAVHLQPGVPDGTQADACYTSTPGSVCTIMVADCLPVLLAHRRVRVVAAAHAGWRGLAGQQGGGVLEEVFKGFSALAQVQQAQAAITIEADVAPREGWEAELWAALVLGVRDYVGKNGFPGALLGLSGGIDSALVLAIAVDALGADKVRTVMMPSPYTADISWIDARDMATRMGVRYDEISIKPQFEAFKAALATEFAGLPEDTTEENLQARIRGTLLMALSNKFGAIVLTTGNKSEMSTGYCTLYGDMAGGFAVIKDVAKTRVFDLARWRNANDPYGTGPNPIPERIITRPPSAELRPDQKDQDSLPPYEVLDAIVARYMENDEPIESIIASGFARADVERVTRLIKLNEYKRRQAPVGIRVTRRSFGKDWRYPITSKFRA